MKEVRVFSTNDIRSLTLAKAIENTKSHFEKQSYQMQILTSKLLHDSNFISNVMNFASENGGVSNVVSGKEKWQDYLKQKQPSLTEIEKEASFDIIKLLSKNYQSVAKENGIMNSTKTNGERLSKITEKEREYVLGNLKYLGVTKTESAR